MSTVRHRLSRLLLHAASLVTGYCVPLAAPLPAAAQNPPVTVTVDAAANRHAIDPRIYGVAYADGAALADLNAPLNRAGGNNSSRYNWQANATNHDFDFFFESIAEPSAVPGEFADTIFSTSKAAGAQAMLTIPMVGWVAKLAPGRDKLASFSVAKYGAQKATDFMYMPDAGNGVRPDNSLITGNDPNDANIPSDTAFQQGWVQHLITKWGTAGTGGVKYYILDNEHSIWFSTHRDVHPVGPTTDEISGKMIAYAAMVKALDPAAVVVGPEEYGWTGYFFSGYDQQWSAANGYNNLPDRTAHGGLDYMPALLGALKQNAVATGQRPIDVFSLHYYPQENEFTNDTDVTTQLLRNRSTRSLWDPAYVDTSYINDTVRLIPRMRAWVNTYYLSGTPIAITEYNWGAEAHINGATAQADVYGIFGREGLDIGARWTTPDPATPTYKAMKLYRNYDGAKSGFGETSVAAAAPNPDNLAAFAALRASDGALTVMVVNKVLSNTTPFTLALSNFNASGTAQAWQLTSANAIARLADVPYAGGNLAATLPPQSITLFVLPAAANTLVAVQSRKTHGAAGPFDLPIDTAQPIGGAMTVQPRAIGAGHTIVFQFSSPIATPGTPAAVDSGGAPIGAVSAAAVGNEVTVTLTGLPENRRVTVSLADVNGAGVNVAASLGYLVGDVSNSRAVNSSDISGVKARLNQVTTAANFRFDLNASGAISSSDIATVKSRSGLVLPP